MKMNVQMIITFLLVGLISVISASEVNGLRGDVRVDEANLEVEPYQVVEGDVLRKNYRQQPPLIPHRIDKYQVNLNGNQCLRCHSWEYSSDFKTVSAPESHYIDAQTGTRTDKIAPGRWFCTQCHVPQSNAPILIENIFNASSDQKGWLE